MNGDHQPGSVIQPGSQQSAAPQQPTTPVAPSPVAPTDPMTAPQSLQIPQPAASPQPTPPSPVPQAYIGDQGQTDDVVSWTASEYIAHQKNFGWWLGFFAIVFVIAALVYLMTRDIFSVIVVAGVFSAAGYYAGRKPTVQQYRITDGGVYIGDKLYSFAELKSFSVVRQGAFSSIQFVPMRRFMPYIPMYYAPDQEETILDTLAQYLPFEAERRQDPIDRLMHKIRF